MATIDFTRRFRVSELNFSAMKVASLLVLFSAITILSGCGAPMTPAPVAATPKANPVTIKAAQVFGMDNIGELWTFQNKKGQLSWIMVEPAPFDAAGTQGDHVILHFTKSAPCAYWGICIPDAEDHFLMFREADGSWRGVADIPTFPQSCPWCNSHTMQTLNPRPVPGIPLPYTIVAASATEGQTEEIHTQYDLWNLWDVNTTDDIVNPADPSEQGTYGGRVDWVSKISAVDVDTPVYKGKAMLPEQLEGPCGHELWYWGLKTGNFNGGIVKLTAPYDGGGKTECNGYGGLTPEQYADATMVRTQ